MQASNILSVTEATVDFCGSYSAAHILWALYEANRPLMAIKLDVVHGIPRETARRVLLKLHEKDFLESLDVGYRLHPRTQMFLRKILHTTNNLQNTTHACMVVSDAAFLAREAGLTVSPYSQYFWHVSAFTYQALEFDRIAQQRKLPCSYVWDPLAVEIPIAGV